MDPGDFLWAWQLMLCFVRLSNNLDPKSPLKVVAEFCLYFFPLPGKRLKQDRLSRNICGLKSESHFTSQDAFLPPTSPPPKCPRTPGFSSSKALISVSTHQRDGEHGGSVQSAVTYSTLFSAVGAPVTTTLCHWWKQVLSESDAPMPTAALDQISARHSCSQKMKLIPLLSLSQEYIIIALSAFFQ